MQHPHHAVLYTVFLIAVFLITGCDKNVIMTETAFQDRALAFLQNAYPEQRFEKGEHPLILRTGNAELGLENLYAAYLHDEPTAEKLEGMLTGHFREVMARVSSAAGGTAPSWDEVLLKVRPQLVMTSAGGRERVVCRSLGDELEVVLVIDDGGAYRSVTNKELIAWNISAAGLYKIGLANLAAASQELDVRVSSGGERYLALETGDGFSAVRLIVPAVQENAFRELGEPFYAVIPTRDSLLMWAVDNPAAFSEAAKSNALLDYQTRPYALSYRVFVVDRRGITVKEPGS